MSSATVAAAQRPVVLHRRGPGSTGADGAHTQPRVLLLHGMASSDSVWNALCARMPGTARLWSADLPWRGEGVAHWSHHRDPSIWLAQALDEMAGADVVVAHSYAATLLLDFLTRQPGHAALRKYGIRGLVLVAPFYRPNPEDFGWDSFSGLVEVFRSAMTQGFEVVAGGRGDPDLRAAMAQRICEAIGPYGWTRFHDLYLRTPWMAVGRIPVPTLVVCGDADLMAPPAESMALARALPAGRLHPLAGCGHFPMIERAAEFAGLLSDFLERE